MAVLTAAAFFSKWNARFADNTTREISEEDMREFVEDIKDSFQNITGATTVESWKSPCAVATTGNITLSGEQTIDGVLTSASRVLVKNQTTTSQNGIYVSAAGAWSRSTDADAGAELEGAAVGVTQGTTQQNTVWLQTSDNVTLGSTAIAWQQIGFGGGTQTLASVLTTGNDAGGLAIENLDDPTNAQDAATKAYVDAEVAGAGGITNGAAANELMKSDGTNAVASGLFASTNGSLTMGTGIAGASRQVAAEGSATDVELQVKAKGASAVVLLNTSGRSRLEVNPDGTILSRTGAAGNAGVWPGITISRAITSVAAATGIGTSAQFQTDTGSGNYEIGSAIESISTNITGGTEAFDLSFKTMSGGAAAAERVRITSGGDLKLITVGGGVYVKEGSNATMGTATLSGGTVTVNTTKVTANSRIFLTANGGTLTNVGFHYVSARTAGTSFTISSSSGLDACNVAWIIIEPS